MEILVTGGCGYIGSALTLHLRAAGHVVVTIDYAGPDHGHANVCEDYRDTSPDFFKYYDAVVHLAGHSSVSSAAADPTAAVDNNLTGLIELLHSLDGIPLLWASSGSVLSPDGKSMYDATKRAAEAIVPILYPNSYALRFGTVCGASPKMRWDLMLNKMSLDAKRYGIITVSNPEVCRPVLAMRDLCAAVTALLKDNDPGVYNLASFNGTVDSYARVVAASYGAEIGYIDSQPTYDFAMECTEINGFPFPGETVESVVADINPPVPE